MYNVVLGKKKSDKILNKAPINQNLVDITILEPKGMSFSFLRKFI